VDYTANLQIRVTGAVVVPPGFVDAKNAISCTLVDTTEPTKLTAHPARPAAGYDDDHNTTGSVDLEGTEATDSDDDDDDEDQDSDESGGQVTVVETTRAELPPDYRPGTKEETLRVLDSQPETPPEVTRQWEGLQLVRYLWPEHFTAFLQSYRCPLTQHVVLRFVVAKDTYVYGVDMLKAMVATLPWPIDSPLHGPTRSHFLPPNEDNVFPTRMLHDALERMHRELEGPINAARLQAQHAASGEAADARTDLKRGRGSRGAAEGVNTTRSKQRRIVPEPML
jgi:hypothetical protein